MLDPEFGCHRHGPDEIVSLEPFVDSIVQLPLLHLSRESTCQSETLLAFCDKVLNHRARNVRQCSPDLLEGDFRQFLCFKNTEQVLVEQIVVCGRGRRFVNRQRDALAFCESERFEGAEQPIFIHGLKGLRHSFAFRAHSASTPS